jgi:histidine ammonia-lyase
MGATSAWNLLESTQHLAEILACEALIACEALEHEPLNPAPHVHGFKGLVRTIVDPLNGDRSTSNDLIELTNQLQYGGWLSRLEAEYGRLSRGEDFF